MPFIFLVKHALAKGESKFIDFKQSNLKTKMSNNFYIAQG